MACISGEVLLSHPLIWHFRVGRNDQFLGKYGTWTMQAAKGNSMSMGTFPMSRGCLLKPRREKQTAYSVERPKNIALSASISWSECVEIIVSKDSWETLPSTRNLVGAGFVSLGMHDWTPFPFLFLANVFIQSKTKCIFVFCSEFSYEKHDIDNIPMP